MPFPYDTRFLHGLLLQDVQANTPTRWFRLDGLHPITVTVEGVGGSFIATVKFYVSNHYFEPSVGETAKARLGPDYTAPDSFVIDAAWKWLGAEVTSYLSGKIAVGFFGGS